MVTQEARPTKDNPTEEVIRRCKLAGEDLKLIIVSGVAYLDGSVASYRQKREVATVVAALPNVRRVVNRLRVAPAGPRSDRQIAQEVLQALSDDPVLSFSTIGVEVIDGVVELTGRVGSLLSRIAAETIAWSAPGVRHVINRLEVAPETALDPQVLSVAIKRGLQSGLGLEPNQFSVAIDQGVVYLQGNVPSSYHRFAAEDMVRWYPFIREVVNQLQVSAPEPLSNQPPAA